MTASDSNNKDANADDSNKDSTPGMCLMARDCTVALAFSGGDGDGE